MFAVLSSNCAPSSPNFKTFSLQIAILATNPSKLIISTESFIADSKKWLIPHVFSRLLNLISLHLFILSTTSLFLTFVRLIVAAIFQLAIVVVPAVVAATASAEVGSFASGSTKYRSKRWQSHQ